MWAGSRVITTAIMLAMAGMQEASPYTPARPDLLDYSTMWDAHWFLIIAEAGYPSELPVDEHGQLTDNAWAFMPVFPMLARVVMLTGLPWEATAVGIALVASAGFAVVAHRLLLDTVPSRALLALAIILCSPLSPVLQIGYAESLGLLGLAACLLAWRRKDWLWLAVLVPVTALTRPVGLALAFAMAIVLLVRWMRRRREPWPVRDRWMTLGLACWAGVWGLAWPLICGLTVGDLDAYVETELVWRRAYLGPVELEPFMPWIVGFDWWFGGAGLPLLLLLVGATAWGLSTRAARSIGLEAWAWVVAYLVYLLAVWFPQTSTFRILMPIFPIAGALALARPAWLRAAMLVVSIALQPVWLWCCWQVVGEDWTVP